MTRTLDPGVYTEEFAARRNVQVDHQLPYLPMLRTLMPRVLADVSSPFQQMCHPDDWLERNFADASLASAALEPAVVLAVALPFGLVDDRDAAHVRCYVRSALLGWQASLQASGKPARRWGRSLPLLLRNISLVTSLVAENPDFQTPSLMKDLETHATWLLPRFTVRHSCDAEVVLVTTATLLRNRELLDRIRRELKRKLTHGRICGAWLASISQSPGATSRALDSLAAQYRACRWPELRAPIAHLLEVLSPHVHPNGLVPSGGDDILPVSPVGIELLADEFELAGLIASRIRRCMGQVANFLRVSPRVERSLATSLALAAARSLEFSQATPHAPEAPTFQSPHGVAVLSTPHYYAEVDARNQSQLHISWSNSTNLVSEFDLMLHSQETPYYTCRWSGFATLNKGSWRLQGVFKRHPYDRASLWTRCKDRCCNRNCSYPKVTRFIEFDEQCVMVRDEIETETPADFLILPSGIRHAQTCAATDTTSMTPIHGCRHFQVSRAYRADVPHRVRYHCMCGRH